MGFLGFFLAEEAAQFALICPCSGMLCKMTFQGALLVERNLRSWSRLRWLNMVRIGYSSPCGWSGPWFKAKKNKLFDCPLITFQRVGRSVGIFFFFYFQHKTSKSRSKYWRLTYPTSNIHTTYKWKIKICMFLFWGIDTFQFRQKGFRPICHLDPQPEFTWRRHRLLCQAVTNSV